ncbi:MAG: non-ribosomal peptide synthetase [Bacteroidota bacterium]
MGTASVTCSRKDYDFFNKYGPTETTITSTIGQVVAGFADDSNTVSIGKPLANTALYILDRHQHLVPQGSIGELYIGGKGLATGYINNSELTAERFVANPFFKGEKVFKTGDLASWRPDGSVEFHGRIDNQVKIRGFRIEPGEIEHQLSQHKLINEVAVMAVEKESGKHLVAYYVADEKLSVSELKTYLSGKLPEYMIPSYFVMMEKMPVTVTGKVDRRALPEPDAVAAEDYVAPETTLEHELVTIWSGVLKITAEKVSVVSSFFEMGGHSLNAVNLVNEIHKELNIELSLQDIFNKPTIRSIATHIENQRWLKGEKEESDVAKTEIRI